MTIDLDAIKARLAATTGETWVPDPHDPAGEDTVYIVADPETIIRCDHRATREFVENAKQDVPALIAEVERLREESALSINAISMQKHRADQQQARAEATEAELERKTHDLAVTDALNDLLQKEKGQLEAERDKLAADLEGEKMAAFRNSKY